VPTIREIRADDKEQLAAGYARLSERSRLRRFLAAIVVGDPYQGKGLGKMLARELADAARARGIRRIRASILSDNPPAHALMRVIAARLTDGGHDHGIHELVAELAA
jgi:acetyltransferase